jgi:hypothetical protein
MKYQVLATIVLVAALAFCAVAARAQVPAPTLFDSMEEAAARALASGYHSFSLADYYEFGGVITKVGDKFAVGYPRTDIDGGSVELDENPAHYAGVIVATYHTHICMPRRFVPHSFSADDLDASDGNKLIGFMGDLCTGKIHEYAPGRDVRPADHDEEYDGRVVGTFPVDFKVIG